MILSQIRLHHLALHLSLLLVDKQDLAPLPIQTPFIDLQQTFAARIQTVEALKASHRAALAELNTLFASLQHRAFRGEL